METPALYSTRNSLSLLYLKSIAGNLYPENRDNSSRSASLNSLKTRLIFNTPFKYPLQTSLNLSKKSPENLTHREIFILSNKLNQ